MNLNVLKICLIVNFFAQYTQKHFSWKSLSISGICTCVYSILLKIVKRSATNKMEAPNKIGNEFLINSPKGNPVPSISYSSIFDVVLVKSEYTILY